ncbi:MAG: sigma-70 family RNA polymerase sigma factor [Planctomycetes bacterium]|nr:sigma-70 family RNA polymerase sigma factor [Planctomycetota bacterium]NQU48012.1 sigma-70 family RNA polymerase sigma factor [Planctomycetota bacterium]
MASDNCLETYLREIDQVPLLTAKEEIALGRRIQKGDAAAREHMIRANLRLVVSVAKRFRNRGLTLPDLIAEGNIGLMKATEKFDPEAGFRFSTYATWWIQQTIRRGLINTVKTVRIPSYMVEILTKWGRAATALGQSMGRPATTDEIAKHLQLSSKNRKVIEQTLNTNSGKVELAEELLQNLAEEHYNGNQHMLAPDEIVLRSDALQTVSDILELIDPKEAQVLKMRYGINQASPSTLETIAKKLKISRERVRQMERTTLRKLHAYVVDGVPPEDILPAEAVKQIRREQAPSSTSKHKKDNGDSSKKAQ